MMLQILIHKFIIVTVASSQFQIFVIICLELLCVSGIFDVVWQIVPVIDDSLGEKFSPDIQSGNLPQFQIERVVC